MATAKDISQEYENWLRFITLVDFAGRSLCRNVLFNQENLPEDEVQLFNQLKPLESQICRFEGQREILCPSSGKTDHRTFDVTLFTNIIKVLFKDKYKSLVDYLRKARNKEFHRGDKSLSDTGFNQLWNDTSKTLVSHGFESKLVDEVKECNLFSHQKFRDIFLSIFPGKKSLYLMRHELDIFFVSVPQFPFLRYYIASAESMLRLTKFVFENCMYVCINLFNDGQIYMNYKK